MYTELCIGVEFKKDTPADVIACLSQMASPSDAVKFDPPESLAAHPLFKTDRWHWMLRSGGSYYFAAKPCLVWQRDEITDSYFLTVLTNIKNYTGEWEQFMGFIAPWLCTQGFLGYYRYEEDDEPTLLYNDDGTIVWRRTSGEPHA
jgi:hypothetical protein